MRSSVAAIVIREGRVLLARRGPGDPLALRWEFPGGKVEEGESDEEAVRREFLEEFGVSVEPLRLLGASSFVHRGSDRALRAWLSSLEPESRLTLIEHAETRWVAADGLAELDLVDSDRSLLPFVLPLISAR